MSDPRTPGSFSPPPDSNQTKPAAVSHDTSQTTIRTPRAINDLERVKIDETDYFETYPTDLEQAGLVKPPEKSRFSLKAVFFSALGVLASLAVGIWVQDLISALFLRSDWLGWAGIAAATAAFLAFAGIVSREFLALRRLAAVENLHQQAAKAINENNEKQAKHVVERLKTITAQLPQTARGRQILDDMQNDVVDAEPLLRLAETEILRPLDREARGLVLQAAQRVSVVTAVSPRALVDIAYVVFESARLIRRLSQLYGGRPGTLGFIRLTKHVLAHLAVTGTLAMGDSLVQQLVGQGLASRLSARLGEGVVNGLMTARIGIATMDVVRPFPFKAEKRPGMSDFIGDIARFSETSSAKKSTKTD